MRIMGIDPGTSSTGVAILDTFDDSSYKLIHAQTILAHRLLKYSKFMEESNTSRFSRIYLTGNKLYKLMQVYGVGAVSCESPYMHRSTNSFAALSQLLYEVNRRAFEYSVNIDFVTITPSVIKNVMKVKGNSSDKEDMRKALLQLDIDTTIDINELDEHSIDAICTAIAYHTKLIELID